MEIQEYVRYNKYTIFCYRFMGINRIFYRSIFKIKLDFYTKMWYKSTTKMEDKCLIIT